MSIPDLMVSVNCEFETDFICGYRSGSTRSELQWTKQIELEFPVISETGSKSFKIRCCVRNNKPPI